MFSLNITVARNYKQSGSGENWLTGKVLKSRLRGPSFEPHQTKCVVSLSKALYTLLSTGSTQEISRHD